MIWHKKDLTLDDINQFFDKTLGGHLGMKFTDLGEDYITCSMPVDERTHQPMGLLHGGASAALAETVGSVAGMMVVNPETHFVVGLEINCNHIRGVRSGYVFGTARPIHTGRTTQVWDIRIVDEQDKLVCASRLTMSVLKKTH